MIFRKTTYFLLILVLWICSCVEPFKLRVKSDLRLLTVDATLTDSADEQFITLNESVNSTGTVVLYPILNAKAELLINNTERIAFIEKGAGKYVLPSGFRAKAGNKYKLFFTKTDGTKYESGEDEMFSVPEIIRVHDEFVERGIEKNYGFDYANYVYLDTKDPANEKNNYVLGLTGTSPMVAYQTHLALVALGSDRGLVGQWAIFLVC